MDRAVTDLDLRLIRTFLAVFETGGITAARTVLNISQPAISSNLAALELRIGFRLCERGRRGFSLTPKGRRFVEAARRLVAASESFRLEVQHINRKEGGTIRVGTLGQIDPVAAEKIAFAVANAHSRCKGLHFHFAEMAPSLLEERIISGEVDVAIGYFWQRLPGVDYYPLFQEKQTAYYSTNHPFFKQNDPILPEDLGQHDWVWASHPLPEMPAPAPTERLTVMTDSMDSAALFILSGKHLGFLPQHYAAQHVQQGRLHAIDDEHLKYHANFHAAIRQSVRHSELVSPFVNELLKVFDQG